MLKTLTMILCLLCTFGCQPATEYTTHREYVETRKLDPEKGLVESSEATTEITWKR